MIFEHTSYRSYLKSVLAERITKNPAYSLRAMAKVLGIQPSHLSAVQNGLKNLSPESAAKIAAKLGLTREENDYFCLLVQYESTKEPELKATYLARLRELNNRDEVKDLSVDAFKAIADWYHIPILEMTTLTGFKFTAAGIAKRLGISSLEAQVAIERLERLELIEKDEKGQYRKTHHFGLFQSPHASQALRHFHKQMLTKAAEAIDEQAIPERYIGSQTFSINTADVAEARTMLADFQQKLATHFDRAERRNETYFLGMQLFRLTNKEKLK